MRLQHCSEEAIGEGEAGEPEQFGWVGGLGPQLELTDPLAKISGPCCQGLQRRVGLTRRDKHPHKLANNIQLSKMKDDCENVTFSQSGGTRPSWMEVKVSSKLDDITTKPLIPFSSSTREDLRHKHKCALNM